MPVSQTFNFAKLPNILYPAEFVFLPSLEHCNFTSDFSNHLIFLLPSIFEASIFVVVYPFRVLPCTEGLRKKNHTGTWQIFWPSFVFSGGFEISGFHGPPLIKISLFLKRTAVKCTIQEANEEAEVSRFCTNPRVALNIPATSHTVFSFNNLYRIRVK